MHPKRAQLTLAILFAINLMNFLERQIRGAVGEDIRKEWELSDTALGTLGTAFTLVYAIVGLPLGRLADRLNRTQILGAGALQNLNMYAIGSFIAPLMPFKSAGLGQAMYVIPVLNVVLSVCMMVAARSVPRDIEKMRNCMRDAAAVPQRTARDA